MNRIPCSGRNAYSVLRASATAASAASPPESSANASPGPSLAAGGRIWPGGVFVVVGVHDFLEGHDMGRGQGGDVIFADLPGFIDPDVEVLGGVHAGKGLMYGNGGLPAVPDGPGDERRAVGDVSRRVEAGNRCAEEDGIDGYEAARGAGHVHAFKRGLVGLQATRADDQIRIQPQGIAGAIPYAVHLFRQRRTKSRAGPRSGGVRLPGRRRG